MHPKMLPWCQKRTTGIELKVRFGDNKHRFYLESVCATPIRDPTGEKLCETCRMIQVQTKTQDVKTFPHGFVLGEYSDESHIFDSPWYHAKVEAYGPPSEVDVAMAMEAQRRARKGIPTKAIKDLIDILVAGASAAPSAAPSGPREAEEVIVGIPLGAPMEPISVKKKNEKEKAKPNTKAKVKANPKSKTESAVAPMPHIEALSPPCKEISKGVSFVESMDDPMDVEIVKIVLKPFKHDGVQYWIHAERGVLYENREGGTKGPCVGRWDSSMGCIMEI